MASRAVDNPQPDFIVGQMQTAQSGSRPTASYQVVREYRLFGGRSSNPTSEVWAEVDYLPPSHKSYVIQKRVGSGRGEDVVRRILQHESRLVAGSGSSAAIDNNNYRFSYLGTVALDGNPCYLLSLDPKRKDIELISGKAWVDQHSFLVRRIEGQMAKTPSWLVKKVDIKIDFTMIEGLWLQSDMEAVAEIRFLGSQTLKSETLDARIGSLVTQKTPAVRARTGKPNDNHMPAALVTSPEHRQ